MILIIRRLFKHTKPKTSTDADNDLELKKHVQEITNLSVYTFSVSFEEALYACKLSSLMQ